jgi:hypothetical protein
MFNPACAHFPTAYSRRSAELWAAAGNEGDGAAGVIGGHVSGEVGGGFVAGCGLMAAPFDEETVGEPCKDAVDVDGVGAAQAALVIAAGDVEAGVEAGFDAPGGAVEFEPIEGVEALGRQAGDEGDGLGALAVDFAAQEGGLGGKGEVRVLGRNGSALQDAGFLAAFVAFAAAGLRLSVGADLRRFGCPASAGSGNGWLREKRQPAVAALCVRCFPAPWAGCP